MKERVPDQLSSSPKGACFSRKPAAGIPGRSPIEPTFRPAPTVREWTAVSKTGHWTELTQLPRVDNPIGWLCAWQTILAAELLVEPKYLKVYASEHRVTSMIFRGPLGSGPKGVVRR